MKKVFSIPAGLSMGIAAVMLHQPAQAQTRSCTSLREVSTHQRSIRKVITLNNTNANTDFAVPTGTRFKSYTAQVTPENNSHYGIEVNLKYNDGSSSKAVSRSVEAKRFYRYDQSFRTLTNRQPYQINTRITGDRNTAYQVSVFGCQ
ncbi:hypothetical protein [Phormidesmis priestleyi]|uniref:hypothetical protein n=1 Tax=Phormidesmis priestleyi TaxID=268141 RepID=UPI00083A6FAD|nr:hypothetical protein [Phormidesmis priestleyi]